MLRKKERLNVSPPEEENLVPTLVDRSNEETSYEDEITSKELYMEMRKRLSSILAAVILLVIGVVFIVVGSLSIYEGDWWYAIPCYIVTFICGIPGAYMCYVIYKIWQYDPDYSWDMVPEFENSIGRI